MSSYVGYGAYCDIWYITVRMEWSCTETPATIQAEIDRLRAESPETYHPAFEVVVITNDPTSGQEHYFGIELLANHVKEEMYNARVKAGLPTHPGQGKTIVEVEADVHPDERSSED